MGELVARRFNVVGVNKRVMMLVTKDREVFFKCKDLAKVLGYDQTRKAAYRHIPAENKYKISDLFQREGHMDPLRERSHIRL